MFGARHSNLRHGTRGNWMMENQRANFLYHNQPEDIVFIKPAATQEIAAGGATDSVRTPQKIARRVHSRMNRSDWKFFVAKRGRRRAAAIAPTFILACRAGLGFG